MSVKLASPLGLITGAAQDWWRWKQTIVAVVGVLAVPATLLSLAVSTSDQSMAGYLAVLNMFMSLALVWTLLKLPTEKPTLSQSYYVGTQSSVRFLLVSFVMACQLLPLVIALGIYLVATVGGSLPATPAETLLIGLVALILATPSFYWLVRSIFGFIFVVDQDARPLAALQRSRQLVKGRFWPVAGRLALLILLLIVGLFPQVLTSLLPNAQLAQAASVAWQLAVVIVLLPFAYLYLIRLYRTLS